MPLCCRLFPSSNILLCFSHYSQAHGLHQSIQRSISREKTGPCSSLVQKRHKNVSFKAIPAAFSVLFRLLQLLQSCPCRLLFFSYRPLFLYFSLPLLSAAHPPAAEARSSRMTAAADATTLPPPAFYCLSLASAFPPPSLHLRMLHCVSAKVQLSHEPQPFLVFRTSYFSFNRARLLDFLCSFPPPLTYCTLFNTLNIKHAFWCGIDINVWVETHLGVKLQHSTNTSSNVIALSCYIIMQQLGQQDYLLILSDLPYNIKTRSEHWN